MQLHEGLATRVANIWVLDCDEMLLLTSQDVLSEAGNAYIRHTGSQAENKGASV